jgi:hypothetical protein
VEREGQVKILKEGERGRGTCELESTDGVIRRDAKVERARGTHKLKTTKGVTGQKRKVSEGARDIHRLGSEEAQVRTTKERGRVREGHSRPGERRGRVRSEH